MKKHWQSILNIIMAIMLVSCLMQISDLKTTVNQLNNNFTMQIGIVRDSVNNISWNVSNALEEQANLLANSTWEYGEMDLAKQTATVNVSITPKEYNKNTTKATVFAEDQEYPLTLQNGSFIGEVSLPLFQGTEISKVSFIDGGNVRSEELNWRFEPYSDLLPQVWTDFGYSFSHGSKDEGIKKVPLTGDITVDIEGNSNACQFESISLIAYSDGKELWRRDITDEIDGNEFDTNLFEDRAVNQAVPSNVTEMNITSSLVADRQNFYFHYGFDETMEVPLNEIYEFYSELVGTNDLVYRTLLWVVKFDENGNAVDLGYDRASMASIYDKEGNLLYKAQY